MNIAYIMRGVPGSGKSTLARMLAGENGIIHSTDNYFYADGEYRFSLIDLQYNHDENFVAFCESLKKETPIVICDNTNVKHDHFKRYIIAAEQAGYMVAVVTMPHPDPAIAAFRSIHKVSIETIQQMINEWEP